MNNQDARFYLSAYRPGGQDARDPAIAGALEQAERDPSLRAWFAQEHAHDSVVAAKLQSITPPTDLRAAILAGGRVSSHREWWSRPRWMAMAAVVAVLLGLAAFLRFGEPAGAPVAANTFDLAGYALRDLGGGTHTPAHLKDGSPLAERLLASAPGLAKGIAANTDELRRDGCHAFKVGGREIFEVCFLRDQYYHLYLVRREDARVEADDRHPMLVARGERAAVTWADDRYVYVLAGSGDGQNLRSLL